MTPVSEPSGLRADCCDSCGASWFEKGHLQLLNGFMGLGREDEQRLLRGAHWFKKMLVCPACDLETLQAGRATLRKIAHCLSCGGFLLPSRIGPLNLALAPFQRRPLDLSSRISRVKVFYAVLFLSIIAYILAF